MLRPFNEPECPVHSLLSNTDICPSFALQSEGQSEGEGLLVSSEFRNQRERLSSARWVLEPKFNVLLDDHWFRFVEHWTGCCHMCVLHGWQHSQEVLWLSLFCWEPTVCRFSLPPSSMNHIIYLFNKTLTKQSVLLKWAAEGPGLTENLQTVGLIWKTNQFQAGKLFLIPVCPIFIHPVSSGSHSWPWCCFWCGSWRIG